MHDRNGFEDRGIRLRFLREVVVNDAPGFEPDEEMFDLHPLQRQSPVLFSGLFRAILNETSFFRIGRFRNDPSPALSYNRCNSADQCS